VRVRRPNLRLLRHAGLCGDRQRRPNPYVCLRREDLELHYFGIDGFKPEDSYGTCLVLVEDSEPLFEAFAAGLRAGLGRLPLTGFPRITRPRRRKNAGNLSGFSLIDPSGNWIRVVTTRGDVQRAEAAAVPGGKLAKAFADAVVLADSKGDVEQAAKILDGALSRGDSSGDAVERVEALAYLAELSVRLEDAVRARALIAQIDAVQLSDTEQDRATAALEQADELRMALGT